MATPISQNDSHRSSWNRLQLYQLVHLGSQNSRTGTLSLGTVSLFRTPLAAQKANSPPAMQETWVWFRGQEDPLGKGMATHSSIGAWEIPWTEEPSPRGHTESGTTEELTHTHARIHHCFSLKMDSSLQSIKCGKLKWSFEELQTLNYILSEMLR